MSKFGLCTTAMLLLVAHWVSAENKPSPVLRFSAEDAAVPGAIPLPASALKVLALDKEVRDTVQYHREQKKVGVAERTHREMASLFSARPMHLNGTNETDFLVMGVGDLPGANVTPFWVLRQTANGYKVILHLAALSVEITEGVGYPEITAYAATAVRVHTMKFHFRGGVYRLRVDKWEDIK